MTTVRCSDSAPLHRQRGLTLVELMVGLALGLIVASALLTLFANASIQGQNLNRTSVQVEIGRYVSELLTEDLRLAGFYGEVPNSGATYAIPDPCVATANPVGAPNWSSVPFTLPAPVRGYGDGAPDCLAGLSRRAGTDAIAMRRVASETTTVAALPAGNEQYHVQYSFCETDPAATKMVFSKTAADFTLKNRACTGPNTLRAYVSRIYYVTDCNRCGVGGDTVPTLKRLDVVGNALVETALAEGVEHLRVEYGFDNDGNGSADEYLTAEAAAAAVPAKSWTNAMTVKAHFITRSLNKANGSGLATEQTFDLGGTGQLVVAADGYTRRAYTTVVRLINPSSAREIQ
jgi:type IV pilus assembly protein PilW